MADPRSGVGEDGSWLPVFEQQRPPFPPGHDVSTRHGAYAAASSLALSERATVLAGEIRASVPVRSQADEVAIRLLAITLVRVERGSAALDESKPTEMPALASDCRGWIRLARQLASDLGMTPTSRARLGLDIARTEQAESLIELAEQAAREHVAAGQISRSEAGS